MAGSDVLAECTMVDVKQLAKEAKLQFHLLRA